MTHSIQVSGKITQRGRDYYLKTTKGNVALKRCAAGLKTKLRKLVGKKVVASFKVASTSRENEMRIDKLLSLELQSKKK